MKSSVMPLRVAMTLAACGLSAGAAAEPKPNIVMHLADDFGWANAGWHRPEGYKEVQTPHMNTLVEEGIELDHAYSYKFCSPTRSAIQSGRNPIHVNAQNVGMESPAHLALTEPSTSTQPKSTMHTIAPKCEP